MDENKELPKRVAVYIRVSTEDQAERFGIDLQKDAIDSLIASKKHTDQPYIFAGKEYMYVDDGISGTVELEERPAFSRLIEDVTLAPKGVRPFDAVAVYKIDRFARKLKILLGAIDVFEQNDLQFISVTESIDTSTPFGRAMLSIIGVIAELERDTISDRTSGGRVVAVKSGVHMGTGAPFGYAKDENKRLVILNEEEDVVKMIFDLYVVQKRSVYEIADHLTKNEYLVPEASAIKHSKHKRKARSKQKPFKWHPENLRRILKNEIYTGRAYYGKTKNGKAVPKSDWILYNVPQIIDDVTFEKAQKIIEQAKHGNKKERSNHQYLLTGLLRCDHCKTEHGLKHFVGTPQTVKSTGKKVYYYQCKGKTYLYKDNKCSVLPIAADAIEDYIVNLCRDMLSNPLHTYKYQQSLESNRLQVTHLRREEQQLLKLIDALPEKLERLRTQHTVGIIDNRKLKEELELANESHRKNKTKLLEVQMQLSQCSLDQGYIKTFKLFDQKYRTMLKNVSKNRDKAYRLIHALIDEIIVYSRPVEESDKVAGRKTKDQMIVNRIHVKFRLPQEMLNEIGDQAVFITETAPVSGASSSQKDVFGAR